MAYAVLYSRALDGLNAKLVTVEIHVANGLPAFSIVGLADTEIKESRDRVKSAITMSGFTFPARRITVNLAPADLPKDSSRFDLPIALGILLAANIIKPRCDLKEYEFAGELLLDGSVRRINGALAIAYNAMVCKRKFILPKANVAEASLVGDADLYPVESLNQAIAYLVGDELVSAINHDLNEFVSEVEEDILDFNQVYGQLAAKKGMEIAASGRHSVLLMGNPGCGKSMLAERLPTITPPLDLDQAIQSASIYSVANGSFDLKKWKKAPFRHPHHSSSSVAIIGGGSVAKPGEISLAHNGILFMDEMPEFERRVLESLREPLESKKVSISRIRYRVDYPADFQLIGALNPCPCGNYGHKHKQCKCSIEQVNKYRARLSEPLLDRIDLMIDMPYLDVHEMSGSQLHESSKDILQRVVKTRKIQMERQGKLNYALTNEEISKYCVLTSKAESLFKLIIEKMSLSVRTYNKILKVARTIADIDRVDMISDLHISESLHYKKII